MHGRVCKMMNKISRSRYPPRKFLVRAHSTRATRGLLFVGDAKFTCSLGRSGLRARKREGDGATPIGIWTLVEVLYRADRVGRPRTRLAVRAIKPADGWCDAVGDRNYNRGVSHPYPVSAERLWRHDHVYDLIVVLSHNRRPRVQGFGSAVFMHLARPGFTSTEGCVAMAERDLRLLLAHTDRRSQLVIAA
ncbi:MAG: L,D-transpeptidase family protein [Hyphomicrobiaceae bacterium]